jgi:hypothetical protein
MKIQGLATRLKKVEKKLDHLKDDLPTVHLEDLSEWELDMLIQLIDLERDPHEGVRLLPEYPELKEMTDTELDRELELLKSRQEYAPLSDEEIEKALAYFQNKWGLTDSR